MKKIDAVSVTAGSFFILILVFTLIFAGILFVNITIDIDAFAKKNS
jgi:peptidoglycan/xylan/chitin deacetylase (PgdA/CDA1 family)